MTYLFGDSSPSDLDIDYIEFLRDALDFAAQVLAADERMALGAAHAVEVRRAGDAEAARLEALGTAQARAIESFDSGAADSATAQCAQALLRGAAETVRSAVERVRTGVAGDVAKLEDEARRDRERCADALAAFLQHHDLPQMSSELRLQQHNGTSYVARLYARGLGDLQAVLELEVPPSHLLGSVARVDKLIERLEVHAPESGGWLRKEVKLRPQRLDKEFITALVAGARETLIHLRTAADGTGVGYDLSIREDTPRVSLRRVGEASELLPFDLDDTGSARVRELRDKLLAAMADLRRTRRALVEAAFGDTPLAEHRDPKVIVERLVAAMAPVVREIAKRSLAPTELVLKRQTGDGRREEIFVSRRDLQLKLRGLGQAARAVFAPLELGELGPDEPGPPKPTLEKRPPDKKRNTGKEQSLFADALAAEEPTLPANPRASAEPPPPPPRKPDVVRIDDSLDRLIVSEAAVRKPE
jgi:hypothetical protein